MTDAPHHHGAFSQPCCFSVFDFVLFFFVVIQFVCWGWGQHRVSLSSPDWPGTCSEWSRLALNSQRPTCCHLPNARTKAYISAFNSVLFLRFICACVCVSVCDLYAYMGACGCQKTLWMCQTLELQAVVSCSRVSFLQPIPRPAISPVAPVKH